MYRLFEFFYQYRAFLFFVFLETICLWLIVRNNNYQGAAYFNSSNRYVAGILESKTNIQDYFGLKEVNAGLAQENARLKQLLIVEQQRKNLIIPTKADSSRMNKFTFVPAKVINNSTANFNNFITIDKGKEDGIKEGMGIISGLGVVGRIKQCSDHYCTALSVLHKNFTISSKIKSKGIDCNVQWDGRSPYEAELRDVTRHQKIAVGDTIVTSGYNSFFPEGITVGKITEFKLEGGSFWKARIELSTDFTALSYVYVIENKLEMEQDSLESKNIGGRP
jgi:rod shape-determining protein MreC